MPSPLLRFALLLASALLLSACASSGGARDVATADTQAGEAVVATTIVEATNDDALVVEADTTSAMAADLVVVDESGELVAQSAPTQAELDFADIYGQPVYDPIYDPTLPAPAQMPTSYDPWEGWNRRVHTFNNAIDRTIATPLAKAYVKVVPRPVRLGVSNFFNNLGQPVSALNALLQGRPKEAGQALGRFVLNATVGIGGIFDPASDAGLPFRSEDFGQTLGVWGWRNSRYLELPLFGPRTLRDSFGLIGDAPLSPIRQIENSETRVFLQGLQLVDLRTQLFAVDAMREGAADEYALIRDAWMQRRAYQIHGDRNNGNEQDGLPDYLLEDDANPTVPVDVMPIVPLSPTP